MQLSKFSNWLYFSKYSKFNSFFFRKIRKTVMSADFWRIWNRYDIFISILGNLCPLNPMQLSKFSNWLYFSKYLKLNFYFSKKKLKSCYVSWFLTEMKKRYDIFISFLGNSYPLNPMQMSKLALFFEIFQI